MLNNVINLKQEDATPSDLITVSRFASEQGCSKSYIYELKNQGKIKFYKRGYWKLSKKEGLKALES